MGKEKKVLTAEEKTILKLKIERIATISILVILVLGVIAALTFKSISGTWWVEVQEETTTQGAYIYFGSDKKYETFVYGVDKWSETGTYKLKGTSLSGYIIFKPDKGNEYVRRYNIRGTRLKIFNTDDTYLSFLRTKTH